MNKIIRFTLISIIVLALSACNLTNPNPTSPSAVGDIPAVGLTIQVQNATDTFNTAGQAINYSYIVSNTGTTLLAGPVTVTDDKATVVCLDVNTVGNLDINLDPGESVTCISSYTITPADLATGSVTNNARARVGQVDSNTATATVLMTQNKVLTITKSANPTTYNQAGQTITFTYSIKNTGTAAVGPTQFVVADNRISTAIICGPQNASLAVNESITCTATYVITPNDMSVSSITNSASAAGGTAGTIQPASVTISNTATGDSPGYVRGSTIQHKVVEGEWLLQIGRCYGADFTALRNANPQIIDPDFIKPDTMLSVPNLGSNGTIYGPPCVVFHTVQAGDTWVSIAQTYNADVLVLQEANKGLALTIGTRIKVPRNSAGGITQPAPNEPIRITLDPVTSSATRSGTLTAQGTIRYVLNASQGQTMTVKVTAPANEVALAIYAPNGTALKSQDTTLTWNGTVPATGDQRIEIVGVLGASDKPYTLEVSVSATPSITPCNRAQLVGDVSVPDGTTVVAGSTFIKTWRLKNTGTCTWTTGYVLIFDHGERMDAPESTALTIVDVPPEATVDVTVTLKAPATPGTYQADFRLRSPDNNVFGIGTSGQGSFWVKIVVPQ